MSTSTKFVDFREVKASVNIVQVLTHYGLLQTLKKEPAGYAGLCPFCESEGRAFRASEEKNCFNCWSCQAKGNVLDFVQQQESCTIRSAALKLVDWFNLSGSSPSQPSNPRKQQGKGQKCSTQQGDGKEAKPKKLGFTLDLDPEHPWFAEAGLEPATVSEFGLGFCDKGILEGCIAFPVHDPQQNLLGYVGYDLSKSNQHDEDPWRFPKQLSVSEIVFNVSRIDPAARGPLVLAFDPLDLVRKWQGDEKRIVSILNGRISRSQLLILESLL